MPRLIAAFAVLVLATVGLLVVSGARQAATARTCYKAQHTSRGSIKMAVKCPGDDDDQTQSATPADAPSACPTAPGNKCQTTAGVWFSRYACYAHPMPGQPAQGAPVWGGHTRKDGSIYVCASVPGTAPLLSTPFFVPNGAQPRVVTVGMVWRLVKRLSWPKADLNIQPSHGWTLVNLPTDFYSTTTARVTQGATLLDQRVQVEMVPSSYRWVHGDGSVQSTQGPGRPVGKGRDGSAVLDGRITHAYLSKGQVSVRVDLIYSGRWRLNGGPWQDLPSTLTVPGTPQPLVVRTATPHLTS